MQDHTGPYQTTEGHIRAHKCRESQKEQSICESLTSVTKSVKFTHIELPKQLKRTMVERVQLGCILKSPIYVRKKAAAAPKNWIALVPSDVV